MTDEQVLKFFHYHMHPLLMHLYLEARIEVPTQFDHKTEGPRIVAALREQGFITQFKTKTNSREKL